MPYTLTQDYTEPYTDGSGRYKTIAKKGAVISWETARALGLVQGDEPTESKAEAKTEAKAKAAS